VVAGINRFTTNGLKKEFATNLVVCLMCFSIWTKVYTITNMKTSNPILRVAACGLAALILSLTPAAHAALTAAQISALGGSGKGKKSSGPTPAAVNALMASATTAAAKQQLAKDIAAYVAVNYPARAGSIAGQLAKLVPAAAVEIVKSAVGANKAVTADVVENVVREVKGTPGAPAAVAVAVAQIDVGLAVTAAKAATQGAGGNTDVASAIISSLASVPGVSAQQITVAVNQVVQNIGNASPVAFTVNPLNVSTSI
jgi:hypothetical protein